MDCFGYQYNKSIQSTCHLISEAAADDVQMFVASKSNLIYKARICIEDFFIFCNKITMMMPVTYNCIFNTQMTISPMGFYPKVWVYVPLFVHCDNSCGCQNAIFDFLHLNDWWLMDGFWSLFWQLEGTVCTHVNSCTATTHDYTMQGDGSQTSENSESLEKIKFKLRWQGALLAILDFMNDGHLELPKMVTT